MRRKLNLRMLAVLAGSLVLATGAAVSFGLLDPATRGEGATLASVWNPTAHPAAKPTAHSTSTVARTPRTHASRLLAAEDLRVFAHHLSALRPPTVPITVPLVPGAQSDDADILTYAGISYADPTAGGVPLQWVEGEEDTWLTPGFTLRDFAPRDGASFARIDPALVEALERLRLRAGSVAIVSGYRHPRHNAVVGGSGHSLHTAGRAADVWSPAHPPLDLARHALRAMGCDIGLGLGPRTLHVDVRGELTTWTYEGAPLSEAAFDAWALTQCGQPVPPGLALAAAATWLSDSVATQPGATADAPPAHALSPEALVERYAPAIAAAVRQGRLIEGAGGVVVDATSGGSEPNIRFVRASSPEAVSLGLAPLISWCSARRSDEYVAYVVLTADGTSTGITNISPLPNTAGATLPDAAPPGLGAPTASRAGTTPATPEGRWAIVVASLATRDDARVRAASLRNRLPQAGTVTIVEAPTLGRYRVTLGPYGSIADAQHTLDRLSAEIADDAWILAL